MSRSGVSTTASGQQKGWSLVNHIPSTPEDSPTDRRCRLCGDETDTGYRRIYDARWEWRCWDSNACAARQDAEAAWAGTRISATPAGIAALEQAKGKAA